MEGYANNSFKKHGGKHEPVNVLQHEKITEAIKAQIEVEELMSETRRSNFDELDEIFGVIDSGRRRSSGQDNYQERISSRFSDEQQTNTNSAIDEMRRKSTSGSKTSNKRTKTTISNAWRKAAMATTLATIVFIGGIKYSEEILDKLEKFQKEWELNNDAKAFHQMIEEEFTKSTFTGDTQIEYDKIAEHLEEDDIIDNRELYTMVAALGEVQTNQVLDASRNSADINVEDYMRSNNITSMTDWREKTAKEAIAKENLSEAEAELEAIFKEANNNTVVTENALSTEGTYGGK